MMSQSGEKKSVWGFVKSAFVEEVASTDGGTTPSPAASRSSVAPPAAASAGIVPERPTSAPDQAAKERLETLLAGSAPPGYVELHDFLSTLSDSIPDETARWRAALKLAAKRGHNVEALLGDFDKCLGILEEKYRQFDADTREQIKKKIEGRQSAIEALDQQILAKEGLVVQIQAEIKDLAEQRRSESAAKDSSEAKILAVKGGFDSAYRIVHLQVSDNRRRLEAFGKASQ